MRLRWGPHASQTAEQVVLRDPRYVLDVLAEQPQGVLASVFRDLIEAFDARPLRCACARCGRKADGVCAYPGSVELIGYCETCVRLSALANPRPTLRISGYEDAVRHIAMSFPRAQRMYMRRIVGRFALAKGGPERMTEAAASAFLAG